MQCGESIRILSTARLARSVRKSAVERGRRDAHAFYEQGRRKVKGRVGRFDRRMTEDVRVLETRYRKDGDVEKRVTCHRRYSR